MMYARQDLNSILRDKESFKDVRGDQNDGKTWC